MEGTEGKRQPTGSVDRTGGEAVGSRAPWELVPCACSETVLTCSQAGAWSLPSLPSPIISPPKSLAEIHPSAGPNLKGLVKPTPNMSPQE